MYAGWNAACLGSVMVAVVQFLSLVSRIDGAVSVVMFILFCYPIHMSQTKHVEYGVMSGVNRFSK